MVPHFFIMEPSHREALQAGRSPILLWLIYCQPPQNFGQKSGTDADAPGLPSTQLHEQPASAIPSPGYPCFQLRAHTRAIKIALAWRCLGQEGEADNTAPHLTLPLPPAPKTAEGQHAGPGHAYVHMGWVKFLVPSGVSSPPPGTSSSPASWKRFHQHRAACAPTGHHGSPLLLTACTLLGLGGVGVYPNPKEAENLSSWRVSLKIQLESL